MEAVEELINDDYGSESNFYWCGPGWGDWDDTKTADENITRTFRGNDKHIDLIVAYKPLDILGANELHKKYKCCLRYNEMYDILKTWDEINGFEPTLVICHHYNDYKLFKESLEEINDDRITFKYIPHSADEKAFKKWDFDGVEIPKLYDVMLVGAFNVSNSFGVIYPLRNRLSKILQQLPKKYKWSILNHPSYVRQNAQQNKDADFFGKAINSTKIAVSDSSIFNYRLGKYIEIPASGTVLAGDIPESTDEDVDKLKQFVLEINMEMTDKQIIDTLVDCLENKQEYETKVQNGIDYAKEYTCEKYAQRFLEAIKD
jgi:hypothetical protein